MSVDEHTFALLLGIYVRVESQRQLNYCLVDEAEIWLWATLLKKSKNFRL